MSEKKHIFVCVQNRPAGHPRGSCLSKGGQRVYRTFLERFDERSMWNAFRLTNAGCLGPCAHGASVVVYPDGVLYASVQPDDVDAIIEEHLLGGRPVERLVVAGW